MFWDGTDTSILILREDTPVQDLLVSLNFLYFSNIYEWAHPGIKTIYKVFHCFGKKNSLFR